MSRQELLVLLLCGVVLFLCSCASNFSGICAVRPLAQMGSMLFVNARCESYGSNLNSESQAP